MRLGRLGKHGRRLDAIGFFEQISLPLETNFCSEDGGGFGGLGGLGGRFGGGLSGLPGVGL